MAAGAEIPPPQGAQQFNDLRTVADGNSGNPSSESSSGTSSGSPHTGNSSSSSGNSSRSSAARASSSSSVYDSPYASTPEGLNGLSPKEKEDLKPMRNALHTGYVQDETKELFKGKELSKITAAEYHDRRSGKVPITADEYMNAIKKCEIVKGRYDKCFNTWYRFSFLAGTVNNACDDYFEDYHACLMEQVANTDLEILSKLDKQYGDGKLAKMGA